LAKDIGYPLVLKAASGGGGKGIRIVKEENQLVAAGPAAAERFGLLGGPQVVHLGSTDALVAAVNRVRSRRLG
ncbi:acetyl-CoA carboxylase biotin carboxylase subunit, partial [Nocardia sp. NPDC004604]